MVLEAGIGFSDESLDPKLTPHDLLTQNQDVLLGYDLGMRGNLVYTGSMIVEHVFYIQTGGHLIHMVFKTTCINK